MNIVYYFLLQFFDEEKWSILLMVVTSFIINVLQTNGVSYLTAEMIVFIRKSQRKQVVHYFGLFFAVSVIYIFLYNLYKHYQNKLLTKLRQWMRFQLVKMLLIVNNEDMSEMNFSKLNSPINRISSVCFMVFNDIITYLLPNITFLIIISIFFLYKNSTLGIGFVTGNLCLLLYLYFQWENMLVHNDAYEQYVNETESYLQEILNNVDKIIYRGQVENELSMFSNKTDKSIHYAFEFYSITSYYGTIMNIFVYAILFACIWHLILLFFSKQIDFTIFVTFFTILLLYRDKMISIIQQIPDFIEFLGRSDSVLKHFKHMEEVYYEHENKTYKPTELSFKTIRFENLSFEYSSSNESILKDLSLTLHTENRIIGITGLSGNGKSTLMKLLLKMYRPSNGTIYIDNKDIQEIDTSYIRDHITYVNQSSKLFDKVVVENMLYGCVDLATCAENLDEVMKYSKIQELYRKLDIYSASSGALGENLSGGQRQIVNIIGGLINPSKILILDEPTNSLDPELKTEILEIIRNFKGKKQCIIIITHDRDVYSLFDETIQL